MVVQRPLAASVEATGETTTEEVSETQPEAQEQELVALPEVEFLPDGFEKEIRRLKNQMRYIGNVNPNAPQEYAELKERHAFLTEQATDLTLAIHKTVLPDIDGRPNPSPYLEALVANGKLGFKSGEGFRKWSPEQQAELEPVLTKLSHAMLGDEADRDVVNQPAGTQLTAG